MLFWKWRFQRTSGPTAGSSRRTGDSFPPTVKYHSSYRFAPRWTQAVTDCPSGERLRYASGLLFAVATSDSAFTSTFRTTRPVAVSHTTIDAVRHLWLRSA